MKAERFAGPVFIIGMPRSGKKLLRDLMNQNSKIGIPIYEASCIPHMVDRFGDPPGFGDDRIFHQFYDEFAQGSFFQQFKDNGRVLSEDDLNKMVERTSWSFIFEFIFRFYAPNGKPAGFIWGEKSPHYLNYMPQLKQVFPQARFIHSIRDPRDCCLSYKKAWGKSVYRAAESWRERMEAALADSRQMGTDYLGVYYESLLENPSETLSNICEFLDCEFDPSMTELTRPPEIYGDTGGQLKIVRDNRKKYLTQLTPCQVSRIEEIVYPVARAFGYEMENDVIFKPVEPRMLKMLTAYDGWASLRFHIRQHGVRHGLFRLYHWHARSKRGRRQLSG